jgi:hypothetical protein
MIPSPERDLAAAVMRLAWADMRTDDPRLRSEAVTFFHDATALQLWCDLLDVPTDMVMRQAAAVGQAGGSRAVTPVQLMLW